MARYELPKLVMISIGCVMFASFVVLAHIFLQLYVSGETSLTLYTNKFNEFRLELAIYALSTIFFPVFLYELNERLDNE